MKIPTVLKPINVAKINKVLHRDAKLGLLIRGQLTKSLRDDESLPKTAGLCKDVARCAIGALLLAAGVPPRVIDGDDFSEHHGHYARLLYREYGLLPGEIGNVENVNDSCYSGPMARYHDVMGVVEFAAWMRANGISLRDQTRRHYEQGFAEYDADLETIGAVAEAIGPSIVELTSQAGVTAGL